MQYLKTFESFEEDPDENPLHKPENKPQTYIFFTRSEEGEDLVGAVEDEDGKTICEVDQTFLDNGIMQTAMDVSGLRAYLTDKKKIKEQDILTVDGMSADPSDMQATATSTHSAAQLTIPAAS